MILQSYKQIAYCFFGSDGASDRATIAQSLQVHQAQKNLTANAVVLARQIHSAQGYVVSQNSGITMLDEGDFLVTNVASVALGVYTADCLPVIMYDPINQAIGIIHAGWPGTLQNIVLQCIQAMTKAYGSEPKEIEIFYGPSCRSCCYKVGPEFQEKLCRAGYQDYLDQVLIMHENNLFFDLPGLNTLQLICAGVQEKSIHTEYNKCTICTSTYSSYRRDKNDKRQLTAVSLTSKA